MYIFLTFTITLTSIDAKFLKKKSWILRKRVILPLWSQRRQLILRRLVILWRRTLLYSEVPNCTEKYPTVRRSTYCTEKYPTVQRSTLLYGEVPNCTEKYPTVRRSTLLYGEVPNCTEKYPTVRRSTQLYGEVPNCTKKYPIGQSLNLCHRK